MKSIFSAAFAGLTMLTASHVVVGGDTAEAAVRRGMTCKWEYVRVCQPGTSQHWGCRFVKRPVECTEPPVGRQ